MAVPKYNEFYTPVLKVLEDGNIYSLTEIKDKVATILNLSDEDKAELLPNGSEPTFGYRLRWTLTYLKKASLIESPKRAHYIITQNGKKHLNMSDSNDKNVNPHPLLPTVDPVELPLETLERVYGMINEQLADDLLTEIMNQSPVFFERLVIKLIQAMGYGVGKENTKHSGDEGIDGVIYEDKLGFDKICIQAKRWDRDTTVGRPDLQKFFGAISGKGKGLFITTAKFSQGAQAYADEKRIILVDGRHLAQLMIEYGVGVSEQKVYKLQRVDGDFFNPEQ